MKSLFFQKTKILVFTLVTSNVMFVVSFVSTQKIVHRRNDVDLREKLANTSSIRTKCSNLMFRKESCAATIEKPDVINEETHLTSQQGNGLDTTTIGNLVVPTVGVGTISWSSKSLTTLENLELQSLVKEACNSNAALFDTAERYGSHLKTSFGMGWGETENLLQKFIRDANAMNESDSRILSPVVATKFTPSPWRTTAESVVEACEKSCERLGVEQIDLYQLHMPDIVKPLRFMGMGAPLDEVYWEGLCECYNRGLVKNVGVSNYGPTLVSRCQDALSRRGVPLASNQIGYSLIGRENGAQETVDKCGELGIKVLGYYPFAMGLLTGKYSKYSTSLTTSSNKLLTSLTSSKKTTLEKMDLKNYANGNGKKVPIGGIDPLLRVMDDIATRRNKTLAQVALNYIICKGVIPIPGSTSVSQLKDNIGAMGWRLLSDEVSMLEEASEHLGFSFEGAGFKRTSEKFVGYGVEKWNLD